MSLENLRKIRIQKRERILRAGENPYPIVSRKTHTVAFVLKNFEKFYEMKEKITLAGRIRSIREHGGSCFFHFEDGTDRIQAYAKRDSLGEKNYRFFLENFDIGDIVEVTGVVFITKRGEKSVEAQFIRMLAKALLPLPEKWHGLRDVEERFRKRYLDLLMNSAARKTLEIRSLLIAKLREFLKKEDFLEVETPILQILPGGALARPFQTRLHALRLNLYLRISPELYLKRLLVGGFEKIYEIGRCFRNEGIDWSHNPDFTLLELYWAYQERDGLMRFTEKLLADIIQEIKRGHVFSYRDHDIQFVPPLPRRTFRDLLKEYAGIDEATAKDSDLKKMIVRHGIVMGKGGGRVSFLDELYKKTVLPKLIQPTFVTDHPIELAILAKAIEQNKKYAHRFQLVIAGMEIINGFSELNDPLEQRSRFEKSHIAPERKDEDFLEALEYGMPPAAGFGLGVDRLAMLLTDSRSMREVIAFPTMRPKSKRKTK